MEKIAEILSDDDLQAAAKVGRAHRVIRYWRDAILARQEADDG